MSCFRSLGLWGSGDAYAQFRRESQLQHPFVQALLQLLIGSRRTTNRMTTTAAAARRQRSLGSGMGQVPEVQERCKLLGLGSVQGRGRPMSTARYPAFQAALAVLSRRGGIAGEQTTDCGTLHPPKPGSMMRFVLF